MRDMQTIRRENLRKLAELHGGVVALAEKLGYTNGSFLVQMCGPNPIREVTERSARRFEEVLKLQRGWLDSDVGPPAPHHVDRMVIDLVRAVAAALEAAHIDVSPSKFADITTLAYEHSAAAGHVDEPFIASVVGLLAK